MRFGVVELNRGAGAAGDVDGAVPAEIHLLPPGPAVVGRDGRGWTLDEAKVTAAFRRDVPIDWNHATETSGMFGGDAPAAGWITELFEVGADEARAPGTWAKVEWTARGRASVASREYRYLSPAFAVEDGAIRELVSVGLTNRPNLTLTALNRAQSEPLEDPVNEEQRVALCQALGLGKDATADQALERARTLGVEHASATGRVTELNSRLETMVPRTELELALNHARTAETELNARREQDAAERVRALIAQGKSEGKITPASEAHYQELCASESGAAWLEKLLPTMPVVLAPGQTQTNGAQPPTAGGSGLTPEETALCHQLDITPEQFRAQRAEEV